MPPPAPVKNDQGEDDRANDQGEDELRFLDCGKEGEISGRNLSSGGTAISGTDPPFLVVADAVAAH